MLTYVIEDSPIKAGRLLEFLTLKFPNCPPQLFGSFQSGLRNVESNAPSLIVLDMTLPTFDRIPNAREGRLRPLGGYDLMRKMKLKAIPSHVIVVTQLEAFGEGEEEVSFAEITSRCVREFPDIFLGSVYFDQGDATWPKQLNALIDKHVGIGKKC